MRFNHIDLQVRDVQQTRAFFQQHFAMQSLSNPRSPAIAILGDGQGFVLVLQHSDEPSYPEGFHVGFQVDDPDAVRGIHAQVRGASAEVSDVIENGRGTMIYVRAPDGYHVEVSCPRRALAPR